MVSGKFKSRRFRKTFVRIPSGKSVVHYKKRKVSIPKCAVCKITLHGIPKLIASKTKNLPKSMKTNNRPFGGNLCSKCMRAKLKEKAKAMFQ